MSVAARSGAITALDHVVVGVRDLDAAVRTMADLLGREPSWRGAHPGSGTANALFRLSNTYLELLSPDGDSPDGAEGGQGRVLAQRLEEHGEGLFALALGTDDVEAFAARMNAWDIDVARPREGHGVAEDGPAERRWFTVLLPGQASRGVLILAIEHRAGSLPEVAPRGGPAAAVAALDHVVVFSSDLEGSRALYGDILGLRLALDRTFAERGQRILFFRVGGATVEVVGAADPEAARPGSDRLWGLAWRVPDLGATRQRLLHAGLDVSSVRPGAKPGTRVCTLRGEPLGVPTLLIAAGSGEDAGDDRPVR
jgi:catechol 2,3-dioxygenase-like lactoylglutathione lyase family enzyme